MEDDKPAKNLGGRPRGSVKLIPDKKTITQIKELSLIQCSQEQAAAVLGVSRNTFAGFLRTHKEAMFAWKIGRSAGDAKLLQMQYKKAMAGNVPMLIWLGKVRLGQKETVGLGGDPDSPPVGLGHSAGRGLDADSS
jgi:hypothetical protein